MNPSKAARHGRVAVIEAGSHLEPQQDVSR